MLMTSRFVLHIGLEKTGTTSIQYFLQTHEQRFIKHGFLYPRAGRISGGHHNLAFALGFSTLKADPRILGDLREEIGGWQSQVILSSENFSINAGKGPISSLRALLEPLADQIMILVYYRPQHEWLQSVYIERKRWGLKQDFHSFCRDIVPIYEALPDIWRDFFPTAKLVIRQYSRRHNVINDFTSLIGLPKFEYDESKWFLHSTPIKKYKDEFGEPSESDEKTDGGDWGWQSVR